MIYHLNRLFYKRFFLFFTLAECYRIVQREIAFCLPCPLIFSCMLPYFTLNQSKACIRRKPPLVATALQGQDKNSLRFCFHWTQEKRTTLRVVLFLVPKVGVEPTRYRYHRILSPARLPIPSLRQVLSSKIYYTINIGFGKPFFCFFNGNPLKIHTVHHKKPPKPFITLLKAHNACQSRRSNRSRIPDPNLFQNHPGTRAVTTRIPRTNTARYFPRICMSIASILAASARVTFS